MTGEQVPDMLILPENQFAVLINENTFADFAEKLAEHPEIQTVFLATDYEVNYQSMVKNLNVENAPSEVPEEITKVSVYLHEGVESYTERFIPRWKEANCAVAGPYWIDTTFANKGIGVRSICKTLDIALADVMAFGDNYNDVSMLDIVGVPYIMDGAAAPLREKYPNHTPRPEDVLREFLKQA